MINSLSDQEVIVNWAHGDKQVDVYTNDPKQINSFTRKIEKLGDDVKIITRTDDRLEFLISKTKLKQVL